MKKPNFRRLMIEPSTALHSLWWVIVFPAALLANSAILLLQGSRLLQSILGTLDFQFVWQAYGRIIRIGGNKVAFSTILTQCRTWTFVRLFAPSKLFAKTWWRKEGVVC